MYWVLAIVAGLIVLTCVVSVFVYYVMFRLTPAGSWQRKIMALRREARALESRWRNELTAAAREEDEGARASHESALRAHLKSIPVSELAQYPGIGPATVERLEAAGYRRVADLRGTRLDIPGLGQKRIADLNYAMHKLTEVAQNRFDSGSCREAKELAAQLGELHRGREARDVKARAQLRGVDQFQSALRPFVEAARRVSFWSYLRAQFSGSFAPDIQDLCDAPLPDLDQCLRAVERPARDAPPAQVKAADILPVATPANSVSTGPAWVAVPIDKPAPPATRHPTRDQYPVARPAGGRTVADPAPRSPAIQPAVDELEQVVAYAFAVARSDGRVARAERGLIEAFVRHRCGDDLARLNRALALCAYYETAAIDLERCLSFLAGHGTADDRRKLFDFAVAIADAAGARNEREAAFLERLARVLRVPAAAPSAPPLVPPQPKSPQPAPGRAEMLATLEIDAATPATANLVRRQYNLLAERYAAGRFAQAGAEFAEMARTKLAAARAAAVALLAECGQKLDTTPAPAAPSELRHNPDLDAMFGGP